MKCRTLFSLVLIVSFSNCGNKTGTKPGNSTGDTASLLTQERREISFRFKTLDQKTVLNRLFDKPEFDSLGMAAWKGNYSELASLSIPLSYDGKFHTSMDTVLYFIDNKQRKCAVAIFSTYNLQLPDTGSAPEPVGCHFCGVPIGAALFFQDKDQQWELYHFQKEFTQIGSFGTYKRQVMGYFSIGLKEIGDHLTALFVNNEPMGNGGYMEGNQMLYAIEEHNPGTGYVPPLKLLFVNAYDCSDSFLEQNDEPAIETVKTKGAYHDLFVTTIHNDTAKKATYQFSDESGSYVEK